MARKSDHAGASKFKSPLWMTLWLSGVCGYFLAVVAGLAPWAASETSYWMRWIGAVTSASAVVAAFENLLSRNPVGGRFDRWLRDLEHSGIRSWSPLLPLVLLSAGGVWLLFLAISLPVYLQESRFVLVPWSWQAIALCGSIGVIAALMLKAGIRATRDAGWAHGSDESESSTRGA